MTATGTRRLEKKLRIRPAAIDDCRRIAELMALAGAGMAEYIWRFFGSPNQDLLEIGARGHAVEEGPISYHHATVADIEGEVVGLLHLFPLSADDPEPVADLLGLRIMLAIGADRRAIEVFFTLPPRGTLYIYAFAVLPEHQRMGVGGRLLDTARERARAAGFDMLSLIALEGNPALSLYRRHGFAIVKHRPRPLGVELRYPGDIVLMTASSR